MSYFNFNNFKDQELCKFYLDLGIKGDYTLRNAIKEELHNRGVKPKTVEVIGTFEKNMAGVIDNISVKSNFILK